MSDQAVGLAIIGAVVVITASWLVIIELRARKVARELDAAHPPVVDTREEPTHPDAPMPVPPELLPARITRPSGARMDVPLSVAGDILKLQERVELLERTLFSMGISAGAAIELIERAIKEPSKATAVAELDNALVFVRRVQERYKSTIE